MHGIAPLCSWAVTSAFSPLTASLLLLATRQSALVHASTTEPLQKPNSYVWLEDRKVAREADLAAEARCHEALFNGELDRETARRGVEAGMGGDNIILEALTNAESSSDLQDELLNRLTLGSLSSVLFPLAMFAVVIVVWLFCCCGACPRECCSGNRCDSWWSSLIMFCRCRAKMREPSLCLKIAALIAVVLLVVCLCICTFASVSALNHAKDGANTMFCTAAKLLNGTFSGEPGQKPFIGILPLLDTFYELNGKLNADSAMLVELNAIVDSTKQIDLAVTAVSGTLSLLSNMLDEPTNVMPQKPNGVNLGHRCIFCEDVRPTLTEAIKELENGLGVALADARVEVNAQLAPQKRAQLQRDIQDTTRPLVDVKNTIRDALSLLVDPDPYEKAQSYMDVELVLVTLLGILSGTVLLACGCSTWLFFVRKEKDEEECVGRNPYYKRVHRCACATWCCGFCYAAVSFLIGGALVAVVVPLSGACLVLDDLDSETMSSISGALDFDMTGDKGAMVADIIDQCLNPEIASVWKNASLFDMMFVRQNGTKITMQEKIVDAVKKRVTDSFDIIQAKLTSMSSPNLAEVPSVISLRTLLRNTSIDAMILPDVSALETSDPTIMTQLQERQGWYSVMFTSAACDDHILDNNKVYGSLAGTKVPGIQTLVDRMSEFGESVCPVEPCKCATTVVCSDKVLSIQDYNACDGASRLIAMKRELLLRKTFRCNVFKNPAGGTCDIYNMFLDNGLWRDDCFNSEGILEVAKVECTLEDFSKYITEFDIRFEKVFKRLDQAVADVRDKINIQARELMDKHVIDPIDFVVEGATCDWLAKYYRALIDGFCYQGVYGLRVIGWCYIACAILSLLLIAVIYLVWRFSVDNYNLWHMSSDVEAEGGDTMIAPPSASLPKSGDAITITPPLPKLHVVGENPTPTPDNHHPTSAYGAVPAATAARDAAPNLPTQSLPIASTMSDDGDLFRAAMMAAALATTDSLLGSSSVAPGQSSDLPNDTLPLPRGNARPGPSALGSLAAVPESDQPDQPVAAGEIHLGIPKGDVGGTPSASISATYNRLPSDSLMSGEVSAAPPGAQAAEMPTGTVFAPSVPAPPLGSPPKAASPAPEASTKSERRCKMGCGRDVAPGTTRVGGRPFDTCCKECAKSKGTSHTPDCNPVNC